MTMPRFKSVRAELKAYDYILRKIDPKRSITDSKVNQHYSITQVTEMIEIRKEEIEAQGVDDADPLPNETCAELLRHVRIALSGIDPVDRTYVDKITDNEAPENYDPNDAFQWQEWESEEAVQLQDSDGNPLGYSPNGELKIASVPPGGGATIHVYSEKPEEITWELTEIVQKDIRFLIGKARVCEIDAVSSVPSLPESISSWETGERVLDRQMAQNEWQRRVDPKRILAIRNFINLPENIIANSAILFSPPGEDSITTEGGVVTINFDFLKGSGKTWFDHWFSDEDLSELDADRRPMWLIDGQHRTRGLSQSEIGSQMEIPVIMFSDAFSLDQSAKVFAEINTLQRKLGTLHTLFMQHRFNIPQEGGKRDFKHWDINDANTHDSRQNNLSYECAGWLASHEGGPLYNRIKILEANQPRFTIIKANSWVDYSRYWFKSQPYGPDCEMSTADIFQEVENYFQAFVNTCNHGDWSDEEPRWSENSLNKGLLQMHSTSRVLLDIYGDVWEKAAIGCPESPIPISRFEEILKPFYWVDWRNVDLLSAYHGSGEVPRTALRVWMREAILNGEMYEQEQAMATTLKSMPGRGILAPPEDSEIEVITDHQWPIEEKGGEVILTSLRPVHALATSRWTITDSNGKEWGPTGGHKVQSKADGVAAHKFKWEGWVDGVESVEIKVQWSNVNRPNAHSVITLTKPADDE